MRCSSSMVRSISTMVFAIVAAALSTLGAIASVRTFLNATPIQE